MSTEATRGRAAGGKPTGIPDDAAEAAQAINAELGRRVNLPGPDKTGVILAGVDHAHVGDVAQVSIAVALADIAVSLRIISGRAPAEG